MSNMQDITRAHVDNQRPPLLNRAFFAQCQWDIKPLTDATTFWQFMDMLLEEYIQTGTGFYTNRDSLLDAFVNRRFYVQSGWHDRFNVHQPREHFGANPTVERTEFDDLWDLYQEATPTFAHADFMIFPSFCIWDGLECQFLWTAPLWRHLGAGRRFVEHFKPASVCASPDSVGFWNKMHMSSILILRGPPQIDLHLTRYRFAYLNQVVAHSIAAVHPPSPYQPIQHPDLS